MSVCVPHAVQAMLFICSVLQGALESSPVVEQTDNLDNQYSFLTQNMKMYKFLKGVCKTKYPFVKQRNNQ